MKVISKKQLKKFVGSPATLENLNNILEKMHSKENKKFLLDKLGKNFTFDLLHKATEKNEKVKIAAFCSHDVADLNSYKGQHGETLAFYQYDINMLKFLCRCGVNIFEKDNYGRMVAHYAAQNGCADIIKMIRVKLDLPDKFGKSPLHYAAQSNGIGILEAFPKEILNQKGDAVVEIVIQKAIDSMLHVSPFTSMEKLDALIKSGVDINLTSEKGLNLLKQAYKKASSQDLKPFNAFRWQLPCVLLMMLKDKKVQWTQFDNIMSYLPNHYYFIQTLTSSNIKKIIQAGLETVGIDTVKATLLKCKDNLNATNELNQCFLACLEEKQAMINRQERSMTPRAGRLFEEKKNVADENESVIWHDDTGHLSDEKKTTEDKKSRRSPRL